MLSKSKIKLITSLKQKKYRQQHQLFVVEGRKTIQEFLDSDYKLDSLFTIKDFNIDNQILVSEKELQRISFLKNTNSALAVFRMKEIQEISHNKLLVALDNIGDPGNLGTIIRLCDWFGVTDLVCNRETVDCYNPKVIQATMGSLTRVNVVYLDLEEFLKKFKFPVYGTFMEGDNIYSEAVKVNEGMIVLGNEANGISAEIERYVTQKISIPRFGNTQLTESLNVATATAITLSELKRKTIER